MFHSSSRHPSQNPQHQRHSGVAAGIYASQALGTIGAPNNLRNAALGGTASDILANPDMQRGQGHTVPPSSAALSPPRAPATTGHSFPPYDTPRRAQGMGSQAADIHMRGDAHYAHSQAHQHLYSSPTEYTQGGTPGLNLQQATPQTASGVPSALQPAGGSSQRPSPSSAYSTPSMPQINTNAQQYTLPTRSNTMNQAQHGYSRSDTSGMEQKYIPFSASAEKAPQFPPTPNQKQYNSYSPATPGGGIAAQSPLVLEHIRPRTNSNLDDHPGLAWNDADRQPTNSNYLAPWPTYAYDWCKWPIVGGESNTAGKMAVGSYLEDPHNFVRPLSTLGHCKTRLT